MNTAAYNPEDLNKLFELDTKSPEAVAALATETVAGPTEELNKLFNLASVEEPLKTGPTSVAASKVEESTELKKGKTYTVYMHDPRNNEYAYLQGYYEAKDGESLDDFKKRICGRSADTCFVFDSPVDKRANKTAAQVNIKDPTLTVQEAAQALELSIFRPETLRPEPTEPEDPSTVVYVLNYYGPQGEQIHREFPTPEERQTYMTEHQPEISRPSLTTVRSNAAAAMSPTDELNQILL